MLPLLLLACAPWSALTPPDPFGEGRSVGGGISAGVQLPEPMPAVSPSAFVTLHPLPRLEVGVGAFVGAWGTDWPRQVIRGGAGVNLRYYPVRTETAAFGPALEFTGGAATLGVTGALRPAPGWSVYAAPMAGVDLGSAMATDAPAYLACGALVRAPVGVSHQRGAWRFGGELSATWSPLVDDAPVRCGLRTYVDAPAPLVVVGGAYAARSWPRRSQRSP